MNNPPDPLLRITVPTIRWGLVGKIVLGSALIVFIMGLLILAYRQQLTPVRENYQGLVVDKWMGFTQSDEGSFPYYRLLVERENGERIKVRVDYDEYQQARVGMWVTKNQGILEFSTPPVSIRNPRDKKPF